MIEIEINITDLPNRATQSQQSWNYNQANRMTAYLRDGAIITDYIVNSQGQRSHKIDSHSDAQTIYQYGLEDHQRNQRRCLLYLLQQTTAPARTISGWLESRWHSYMLASACRISAQTAMWRWRIITNCSACDCSD